MPNSARGVSSGSEKVSDFARGVSSDATAQGCSLRLLSPGSLLAAVAGVLRGLGGAALLSPRDGAPAIQLATKQHRRHADAARCSAPGECVLHVLSRACVGV